MTEISGAKLMVAFWGLAAAFSFLIIFSFAYFWLFKKDNRPLKLFLASASAILFLAFLKALVFYLRRGYIFDRLLFYAVPSPKALGLAWLLGASLIFILFLRLRKHLENLNAFWFLASVYLVFTLFAVSVAAVREGFYGVYEPFTRTQWEYTGNLPLISGARSFLGDYADLIPRLAIHSRTHPPGYTLALYFFQKYFHAGLPALAVFAVALGGLAIFPLYYFLKNFASEEEARRGIEIFAFLPGVVMMTATSMEATFMSLAILAICLIYAGLKSGPGLSFLGGLAAALALFSNFLFILLLPLFAALMLIAASRHKISAASLASRAFFAALGFLLFFAAVYYWSGYSIIRNFLVSRSAQGGLVQSNFASVSVYFTYFFMNLASFGIYLGIPSVILLARRAKSFFAKENFHLSLGFIMVALFALVGVFQGETERIWLFLMPLFILPAVFALEEWKGRRFDSFLALLFFQTIFMQILFYTYW